jgi:hypothetical protein
VSSASRVMLVGDGPFNGQLDRILSRAGVSRDKFDVQDIHRGIDYRSEPKVIVAMGETALRALAYETGILRWRGRVVKGAGGTWVVPTLHPRDLMPRLPGREQEGAEIRNPSRFLGAIIYDIRRALEIASLGFERVEPFYLCDPSPEAFAEWANTYFDQLANDPDLMLSWDIETPYKLKEQDEDEFDEAQRDVVILRISFAYRPGTGVSVPWTAAYLPSIERLLRSRGTHVVWNGDAFDVPLVRSQGLEVAGEVQDYMWGWHLYQSDLPMGLEFVSSFWSDLLPWKHLNNSDPARYSAIDADAALRNALGIRDALRRTNQWDAFRRHIVQLDPLLFEAGARGSRIDLEKQAALREKLGKSKAELVARAQTLVPEELKPRKRYKRLPEVDGTARQFVSVETTGKVKRCSHCGAEGVKKGDHFKGGKKNPCKVAGATIEEVQGHVMEWDEILPFNPNSSEQIKAYIRHYSHPMGTNKTDREKESADSKHLEKLSKKYGAKHPIYSLTIELHKVSKALSTYVVGFRPDALGLIHTTYTHAPSTWRLSSRNVNLQNVGKSERNPFAKEARKQIVAREGHVFVQADSSAIEAVMVGWFMGDPDYIEIARKGVHAKLACARLGWEFDKPNVKRVKEEHALLYSQCKVTVHGTSYGMTPNLMTTLFPDLFPSRGEAEAFQRFFLEMVPKLGRWQHETRVRAHKETFLENPWKVRHYFYDVFNRINGELRQGSDGNRAIAFLPQSSAGCFMKDNIILLGDTWAREFMPAHLSVHDSLCLDVPKELEMKAIETLIEILTRPIPEMGGLRVGCEVETGPNWGEMESRRVVTV